MISTATAVTPCILHCFHQPPFIAHSVSTAQALQQYSIELNGGVMKTMLHRSCRDLTLSNVLSPLPDQQAHMKQQFPTVARAEYYTTNYYDWFIITIYTIIVQCCVPVLVSPHLLLNSPLRSSKLLLTLFWMPVWSNLS